MKFCCVASRGGEKRSYIYIYVWNIFGNLVVIFFYLGNFFFYDLIPDEKVLFVEKFCRGLSWGWKDDCA